MLTNEELKSIVARSHRDIKDPFPELTVHNFEEGVAIWNNKDVKTFFFQKSMNWQPKNKIAVFLPCAACKPYPYSDSHRDGYLKALLPYLDRIDLFVVSEPMGIVPYCYSNEFPVDACMHKGFVIMFPSFWHGTHRFLLFNFAFGRPDSHSHFHCALSRQKRRET